MQERKNLSPRGSQRLLLNQKKRSQSNFVLSEQPRTAQSPTNEEQKHRSPRMEIALSFSSNCLGTSRAFSHSETLGKVDLFLFFFFLPFWRPGRSAEVGISAPRTRWDLSGAHKGWRAAIRGTKAGKNWERWCGMRSGITWKGSFKQLGTDKERSGFIPFLCLFWKVPQNGQENRG